MRLLLIFNCFFLVLTVVGQTDNEERLDEKTDRVTYQWDLEADKLATYEGLLNVCGDSTYRSSVISLLNEIHHLDSSLYDFLIKLSKKSNEREIKRTIKDIESFEHEYGTHNFIKFMREECKAAIEIESEAEDTRNEVGQTSYSGRVYVLETELFKYVKNITKRVDRLRTHVHRLSHHHH